MDDGTQHKEHGINENVPQDRYHKNDFGPFSTSHMLVLDVPSQPKIKLNVCDRDIVLCVAVNKLTIHLLHLRNVRDDTVYMAWGAIQKFLKELKALNHASDKGWGFIVLHVDEVHDVHEDIRQLILAEAKKCGFLYHWSGTAYLRPKLRESNEQIYFTLRWRDGKLEANLRKCHHRSFLERFATTFTIEDYLGRPELQLAEASNFTGIISVHLCYSLTEV
ncbi:unnamed protein product [Clonostachys chloroleuca]|uniref:Uncharacterized protein n=1 Tax=Clonostachys chloroleuca TaxID=1926264 RepID=A0AA35M5N5_9HYPO|nr:unnamed protein product [Clonostachys chloroleuca]CAI6090994.1 unnamed protein product [Clonostachys chloroleuca]CAI6090995.1 unnamed protein product [Clonostachys chloroleuca]CAI6090997.1 unnamed protein product [Clonostachys chloroleuca]